MNSKFLKRLTTGLSGAVVALSSLPLTSAYAAVVDKSNPNNPDNFA